MKSARQLARELGQIRYHGRPCRNCGKTEKYTSRAMCVSCFKDGEKKAMYGMAYGEYQKLLISQNYECKICGVHRTNLKQNLSVDHDHLTGKIRGLLCQKCNTGLGYFNDDFTIVQSALDYLKETENGLYPYNDVRKEEIFTRDS